MVLATETDVTLYVPPDRPWDLKLRSKQSFKRQLEDVVRLWKLLTEARGDDPTQIDLSYVVRRMLEAGVEQAFGEYGRAPESESDWKAIELAVQKATKKSR